MANTTVALIGYGYWGPNLLRNYMELPTADVRWVCDSRPDRLAKVAERYPAVGTTALISDVLDDPEVDAVLIATPIGSHYELSMKALRAGKHVFVGSPWP